MDNRWHKKIAIVTGASAGIGASIVKELIKNGMIVIGLARRLDKMEEFKQNEIIELGGEFHPYECDVSSLHSIQSTFEQIVKKFDKFHVLINNAGILKHCPILTDDNEDDLQQIINVNLMGSIYCIKEFYKVMKDANVECHIININSILGHSIPFGSFGSTYNYNLYPSSKYALRAATEVLRQELNSNKNFRISSISPGLVKTEIAHSSGNPNADHIMGSTAILAVEDISRAVIFALDSPKHVQISEMIINPVGQSF